jgi:NAD(P)-dependent dehydrogenase (short-subunit alcohol dehydrogenase family)
MEKLVDRAAALAGRLDILVNNASVFPEGAFEDMGAADLHGNVNVNALAPFVLGRSFARQARGGHIVNFLDTRITGYDWQHAAYHASKVLLAYLTRVMALRFAPGTAVNAVAPGLILPPEGRDAAYLGKLKDTVPLKRVGNPAQITKAVLYLVTSEYLTGQVIFVDGGRHLLGGWPPAP